MTSIIYLLGMSLVLVDSISSGRLKVFMNGISSSDLQHTLSDYQDSFVFIGSQFILVIIMASIANKNREASKLFIFLLLALWVVYAVKNPGGLQWFFGVLSGKIKPIGPATSATNQKGVN